MAIRVRGHHLLCLLTYVGKGYTADFTRNFTALAQRVAGGEALEIVDGPDDFCAPVANLPDSHCDQPSVADRDRRALKAVATALGLPADVGQILWLQPQDVQRLRDAFRGGELRTGCAGCEWFSLCDRIADNGFCDTVMHSPAP